MRLSYRDRLNMKMLLNWWACSRLREIPLAVQQTYGMDVKLRCVGFTDGRNCEEYELPRIMADIEAILPARFALTFEEYRSRQVVMSDEFVIGKHESDELATTFGEFTVIEDSFNGTIADAIRVASFPYDLWNTRLVILDEPGELHLCLKDVRREDHTILEYVGDDARDFLEDNALLLNGEMDAQENIQHALLVCQYLGYNGAECRDDTVLEDGEIESEQNIRKALLACEFLGDGSLSREQKIQKAMLEEAEMLGKKPWK
jgi:hypothetical protein